MLKLNLKYERMVLIPGSFDPPHDSDENQDWNVLLSARLDSGCAQVFLGHSYSLMATFRTGVVCNQLRTSRRTGGLVARRR